MAARFAAMSREVWSTTSTVLVTDPAQIRAARSLLDSLLLDVELVASRFRPGTEIDLLNRDSGAEHTVSPLLADLLDAALRMAAATDGIVDPTVGAAVIELGYDRDIRALSTPPSSGDSARNRALWERALGGPTTAATGFRSVRFDRRSRRIRAERGTWLDLGATAKAWTAYTAATTIAAALGCGVLVNLGGDIRCAGTAPVGGWQVGIADDHRTAGVPGIAISAGGVATSSTAVRRWRHGSGQVHHHLVDPRTGGNPIPHWRTVSVTAPTALAANAASTAAIVLATDAVGWLGNQRLAARLVGEDDALVTVGGWPAPRQEVA